ncbi:MAG: hypothetical protein AB1762_00425 [Gemmatimonadota bacterium]
MRSRGATVVYTVLAYIACTFGVQGVSHFVVNADHYAAIAIMRTEPIVPMGIASMVIQGTIFGFLFPAFNRGRRAIGNGLVFSWSIGAFLASYIALGEAGKYGVPSIASWVVVEVAAAAAQFTLFGIALGLLHRQHATPNAPPARG